MKEEKQEYKARIKCSGFVALDNADFTICTFYNHCENFKPAQCACISEFSSKTVTEKLMLMKERK